MIAIRRWCEGDGEPGRMMLPQEIERGRDVDREREGGDR